jgi:hypothetical protein
MATSQCRVEANRANARRSTGPRTARGKRASSRNALAHGLTARAALLPGDDPEEYRRFAHSVLRELDPHGPMQEELVGEIANLTWKLRRAPGAESILLVQKHFKGPEQPDEVVVNVILDTTWKGNPNSPLWLLNRYTHHIVRERAQAMRMFLALKKQQMTREEADADVDDVETNGIDGDGEADDVGPDDVGVGEPEEARGENSLVQNEPNVPGEAAAVQPSEPQADTAGDAGKAGGGAPSSEPNVEA